MMELVYDIMPEETNRVLTDHCSDLLFCPTETAVKILGYANVRKECPQKNLTDSGGVQKSHTFTYFGIHYRNCSNQFYVTNRLLLKFNIIECHHIPQKQS